MNSSNNPFSTNQWIQQHPNMPITRSGDEPYDDTSSIPVNNVDSGQGTTGQPAGSRPIRRRSRSSRRTPTTVLNASPTDFRALVQRFTGCDNKNNVATSASASASVLNLPKGPVNIDFARPDQSSSPRYTYFDDNQVTSSLQVNQMSHLPGGYGIGNANSVAYDSIDESSFIQTQRNEHGSHGYNG